MFANERRIEIIKELSKNGAVTTSGLVKKYKVSIETIRRDLALLEVEGKLSRVHGGAVISNSEMKPFLKLSGRNKEFAEEKRIVSLNAASFINEGDIIAIDSGSTAIVFAEILKQKFSQLTVVTHSKDVFDILCNYKNFEVILAGGHYLRDENAFCGELCIEFYKKIYMKKGFIFPSAVSLEYGICDYNKDLYSIQKELLNRCEEIYILADSSKFEKNAMLKLCDTDKNFVYITDNLLKSEIKNLYLENDIKICNGRKNNE